MTKMMKFGCVLDNYLVDMSSDYQYSWADEVPFPDSGEYLPYKWNYRNQYAQIFKFDYWEWMWNIYQYNWVNYLWATNIFKYRRYDWKVSLMDCIKFINNHVKEPKDVYRCFEFDDTFKKYNLLIKQFK